MVKVSDETVNNIIWFIVGLTIGIEITVMTLIIR